MSSAALLLLVPLLHSGPPAQQSPAWDSPALEAGVALLPAAEEPFSFGWLVRAFYTKSPEEAGDPAVTADASGFVLEDLDGYFAYDSADVAWRLGVDLDQLEDGGDLEVEDAWARWQHFESLALAVGRFKPRVLRSASVPPDGLLLRERTFLGAAFDQWDDGFELGGLWDEFGYALSLTDGANGESSKHFLSARGVWALVDDGMANREGALEAPNHLRVVLGASVFQDDAQSDGGWAGDLAFTFGPYGFHGEWASLGEDFTREIDVFDGHLLTLGDGEPFSATLSRRLGTQTELALRYQSADEADSTEATGVGASWTPAGSTLRFVADLELVEGDTRDFSLFTLGVELGSSGLGAHTQP